MGPAQISCGGRPALSRQCAGVADAAQHGSAGRARDQGRMGRRHVAARLFAATGCHDGWKMGHGGLNQRVPRRFECVQESVQEWLPLLPNALSLFLLRFSRKPHSRIASESALLLTARLASNLEVFSRSLAAIGNLFVFDRLSFVERGKTSFLDRRNMNENVFAATRRLDETKTLGGVEPLHGTFAHQLVSA